MLEGEKNCTPPADIVIKVFKYSPFPIVHGNTSSPHTVQRSILVRCTEDESPSGCLS